MKNNSEIPEKTQFATSIPTEQKRVLKTLSAMTGYSLEQLTIDAFAFLLGQAGSDSLKRKKEVQNVLKALGEDGQKVIKSRMIASCSDSPWGSEQLLFSDTCTV